jgi:hypothetical protein
MRISLALRRAACCAGLAAAVLPAAARADKAIVVGVNQYPGLKNANLAGCVSDAKSMAALLVDYGFQVRTLTDTQATKQGIMNALAAMKAQCKPNEKFVFFFAGHGTDTTVGDKAALLPNDAQNDSADNDLKREELYTAIRAVPAMSHTALLDSCYSGGMLKSFRSARNPTRRNRYYARDIGGGAKWMAPARLRAARSTARSTVPVRDADPQSDIDGGAGVCYYTAARDNEQAAEEQFDSERHGVFTYYLTKMLAPRARDAIRPSWGDVHKQVADNVALRLRDAQHPTLSNEFAEVPLFGVRGGEKASNDSNLWDEINADNFDPAKLKLTLVPNKTTITVGEEIKFQAVVGEAGYLVIFEKGTSGKMNIIFPLPQDEDGKVPGTVEHAAVSKSVVSIPDGKIFKAYTADTAGTEYLKALLFPDKQMAETFLTNFPAGGATREQLRDLQRVRVTKVKLFTSDITFEVVPPAPAPKKAK